jgi:hypothetical protein
VQLPSNEQGVRLANRFDVLPREERWRRLWMAGPAAAPPSPAPLLAGDGPPQMASWNAIALTEQKVHELLDMAVATATLVVAVQEIGVAPAGRPRRRVGGAVQLLLVWCPQGRRPKGRGVSFLVHASLRASVALQREPLATADNHLELAWLRVQLKRRRESTQHLYIASV